MINRLPVRKWRLWLIVTLISGGLLAADQLTKTLVRHTMDLYESIPIIPFLNLTYTRNPGAAFSLFADADAVFRFWFFTVISTAAVILVVAFLRRVAPGDRWTTIGLALILGGAIGNLIDRLRFGEVIDFIDVYVGRYHWPIFNFADSGITVGMIMLLGQILFDNRPSIRPAPNL